MVQRPWRVHSIHRKWYFLAILAIALGFQLSSAAYYFREQAALANYLSHVANLSSPPSELAKDVLLSLKNKPDENDSYFLSPLFRPLRPAPWQIIEKGGDCADRSRVLIALLRLRGIHASKWALYNARGESVHAVVEADVESGKMVVDPLFGLWFPRPQGGYYDIAALRQDPKILSERIAELRAQGVQPGTDRLDFYPLNQYVYANARTINWNKNAIIRFVYLLLHRVLGERANYLARPAFVEEPPLMVIYGLAVFEFAVLLTWLLAERRVSKSAARAVSR
ncbi:MAG TPA: hypothetical protein VJY15_26280 [Candidatus Acidoferrum sp.]|nr:hypothetical protein [Candidatus Acidoferrum sp.]